MKVVMEGRVLLKMLKQVAGVAARGTFAGHPGLAKLSLPAGRPILLAEAWDGVLGVRVWGDVGFPRLRGPAPRQNQVEEESFIWDAAHALVRSAERPLAPVEAEPGEAVVPVAALAGILAGFEDRWVQLVAHGAGGVSVKLLPPLGEDGKPERERGGQWRLAGPGPEAWPAILYERTEAPSLLPPAVVARLGQAVDFASRSREQALNPIGGVRLVLSAGRARIHATDGHVLVAMDMTSPSIICGDRLPAKGVVFDTVGVALLASLVGNGYDPVELHVQASGVVVATWGDAMVSLPIRQGNYPPVETAMPAAVAMEVTAPPRDLAAALLRCESLRDQAKDLVAVVLGSSGHVVGKTNLVVSLTGSEAGEGEEVIPALGFTGPADLAQRPRIKVRGADLVRLLKLVEGQAVLCLQSHDASGFTTGMALVHDTARPDFIGGLMPLAPSPHA